MRFVFALSVSIGLCAAPSLFAQPDSSWSRTFGGGQDDEFGRVIQTSDGGFAIAGYTYSFGAGEDDFWLVRTDSEGDSLWSRTFGGENRDEAYTLIQTSDGGFALAGMTGSFGVNDHSFWLVRMNADGDSLWSRIFSGENIGDSHCFSLLQMADGGFALAGFTDAGMSSGNFWLVRTDSGGDRLWSRTFGGGVGAQCNSLIQTADGGFVLAGLSESFRTGRSDFWLVRTDSEGNELWSRTFGGGAEDECYSLIQTTDGGFALAGLTNSFGAGGYDFWLVRTNADGDSLWSRTFGGGNDEWCVPAIQTVDGGFALAGFTNSFGAGNADSASNTNFWLVRTDSDGDSLWSRTFGGESEDICYSLIKTAGGGFALAGYTSSFGAGGNDFWLIKTGPDPVSVPKDDFSPHPSAFILSEVYPNPFNQSSVVSYQLPVAGEVNMALYDMGGRLVRTLENNWQSVGEHRIILNAAGYPAGTYWVRLNDNRGGMGAQPVVLVK